MYACEREVGEANERGTGRVSMADIINKAWEGNMRAEFDYTIGKL